MCVEYGTGPGGLPYHRFGSGEQPLVVVPGVMDSLGWNTPRALNAHLLASYYFDRLREYDVWVLSRPPGLSDGATVASMAERYADALDSLGAAHVLGFSLGGAIGANLAASRPDLVDSLILAGSGHSLGPYGKSVMERWEQFATEGDWPSLHVDYSRVVYAGLRRSVVPPLYRLGGRLLPTPVYQQDPAISIAAARSYNGRETLSEVEVPTLALGGQDDALYPTSVREGTANLVADGYVATLPGGHAVYEESSRTFAATVSQFLSGCEVIG